MNQRARELASILLDRAHDPRQLRPELMELVELCSAVSPIVGELEDDIGVRESAGEQGIALSTRMAAMCAEDFLRTLYFQRGVAQAVAERALTGARPTRILYAGCGPWAMLLLPALLLAKPGELEVELVELQARSARSARQLLSAWGLDAHCLELVEGDALAWQLADGKPAPDVVVTETMQAGLFREPQVALSRWLIAQAPQATLVPRRVEVRLAVGDPGEEFAKPGPDLGVAFALDREAVSSWRGVEGHRLPGAQLVLPGSLPPGATPFWRTRIEVAEGQVLQGPDSGLTTSLRAELGEALVAGRAVECWYELGVEPGMRGRVVAGPA